MEELFKQRQTELELAAKNTIVEMHMIKAQSEEITRVLSVKEKQLEAIDAALRELDHTTKMVAAEEQAQTRKVQAEADKAAQADKDADTATKNTKEKTK